MIFNVVVPRCPISIPPVFGGGGGGEEKQNIWQKKVNNKFPEKISFAQNKTDTHQIQALL